MTSTIYPLLVSQVIFPLHERLKGKPTYARLRELERTQWLSPDAIRELQFRRLKRHLEFAYRHVPYYRQLLDEHELPPPRITSFDDFSRIPALTREIIRRRSHELRSHPRIPGAKAMSTGGSTGAPVTVLTDREKASFADAARIRAHRWFGADVGVSEVVLWGSPIERRQQDAIRNVRDWLINSKFLSAFDMGQEALATYARIFERRKPAKLFGYASAIFLLARYLRRIGWKRRDNWPRAVFVTAEPLYPFQRDLIELVFGAPVAVEYGARDAGLIANECPAGGLHINAEGVLVEIGRGLDTDGTTAREVIVTNLDSFAMPIIRYRMGDIAALGHAPCACGRGLPLMGPVQGRTTDFLVTPEGRVMHALAVIYILRENPSVREFQVVQERLDRLRLRLVPDETFSDGSREAIVGALRKLFGSGTTVNIELVDAFPGTPSGKFRYVVSHVAEEYLASALEAW